MSFEPILLAPQEEIEEVYPFRRVWRTSSLEVGILLAAVIAVLLLTRGFGVLPPATRDPVLKTGIAVLPLAAWLVFSYRGERRALQPRPHLGGILLLGALVANAVAVPLEQYVVKPEQWLPQAGFFARVLGYMLTMGIAGEFLKYAVLRYTVWPERFRQRLDGIAYALAVSVGYAVVFNLRFALQGDVTLAAAALRVASITFSQLAIGLIMGFFLAELRVGRPPVFWLPLGLILAAFLSGLYYAFRGLAIVGGLGVGASASAPLRGLALAFGLVVLAFLIVAFIVESADTRMEALTGRRHAL